MEVFFMARPKNEINRIKILQIRMTEEEYKRTEILSKYYGKTVSKCIRDMVDFNYNSVKEK